MHEDETALLLQALRLSAQPVDYTDSDSTVSDDDNKEEEEKAVGGRVKERSLSAALQGKERKAYVEQWKKERAEGWRRKPVQSTRRPSSRRHLAQHWPTAQQPWTSSTRCCPSSLSTTRRSA